MDFDEMKKMALLLQLEDVRVCVMRDERPMMVAKLTTGVGCLVLVAALLIKLTF